MEHVILGLLMLKSQTLYELNRHFGQGIALFYSASYGSLQTAIKKLLEKGLIEFEERVENGRHKKVYAVLPQGRDEFFHWMHGETPDNKLEVAALSKIYFLGLVEKAEDKQSVLKEIVGKLEAALANLESMDRGLEEVEVPDAYRDVFHYQRHTLSYGIGSHRFAADWVKRMLKELE